MYSKNTGKDQLKKNENDFKKRGLNLLQKSTMPLPKYFSRVGFLN